MIQISCQKQCKKEDSGEATSLKYEEFKPRIQSLATMSFRSSRIGQQETYTRINKGSHLGKRKMKV